MQKSVLSLFILISLLGSVHAQKAYVKKLERKIKQRMERKADQKTDQVLDAVEESIEGKSKSASESTAEPKASPPSDKHSNQQVETMPETVGQNPQIPGFSMKTPEIDLENLDLSFGEKTNAATVLYEKLEIGTQRPVFEKEATYPNKKRYLSKSGKIEMARIVVNPNVTIEVRETVYYDQWGWKEARLIHEKQKVSMMGFNQVNESFKLTIMDGENLATVDLKNLSGGLSKNSFYEDLADMTKAEEQQFAKGVTEGMDAKTENLPSEKIAGKTCKVTRVSTYMDHEEPMMVSRLSQWQNILLKSESKGMGSVIKEQAFQIEEGSVPPRIFFLPVKAKLSKYSMEGIPGLGGSQNRNK